MSNSVCDSKSKTNSVPCKHVYDVALDTFFMLLASLIGAGLAIYAFTQYGALIVGSVTGQDSKGFWDLSRVTGVMAYLMFWGAIVLGLLMSNKFAKLWPGGPTAYALHEYMCLIGLAFAIFHAGILLGDKYMNYSVAQIAVPFMTKGASSVMIGLGQIGIYLLAALVLSYYVRPWIGFSAWRWIHFTAFMAFALITVHGLLVGTDTKTPLLLGMYLITNVAVFFFTFYRIFNMIEVGS